MLSYRHAFHAGNHADVLKHFVFSQVLQYFNRKEKPYWVIDTHAGAGLYRLFEGYAQKNGEFKDGIARLLATKDLPPELTNFCELISSFNLEEQLSFYPGSPSIAADLCRADDKLRLFELHPQDFELLSDNFIRQKQQVKIQQLDGFSGLKSCLPPSTKRAVILIDPSYEIKDDYDRVTESIKDSMKRFATGTYCIWYPLLQREEPATMLENLLEMQSGDWLSVTLSVEHPSEDGFGMFGSGMIVINPPWTLPKTLEICMPTLKDILAKDDGAAFTLDFNIT
jgi:23S rRNA (adenine2030-N6)-methyltransferase